MGVQEVKWIKDIFLSVDNTLFSKEKYRLSLVRDETSHLQEVGLSMNGSSGIVLLLMPRCQV